MRGFSLPPWVYTVWWIAKSAWFAATTRWLVFFLGLAMGLDAGVRLGIWAAG